VVIIPASGQVVALLEKLGQLHFVR
jgi:hypothetical protein